MIIGTVDIQNSENFFLWEQEPQKKSCLPKKRSDYYPFGLVMPGRSSNSANPNDAYKFTGYEHDDEAGIDLYHANARGYDPVLGRFMQVDPHGANYPSLSPYAYTANNPLNYTDPDGRDIVFGTEDEAKTFSDDLNRLYSQHYGFDGAFSVGSKKVKRIEKNEDGEEVEVEVDVFTITANEEFDWSKDEYTSAINEVINSSIDITGSIVPDLDRSLLDGYGGGRVTGSTSFELSGQLSNYGDQGTISRANPSKYTTAGVGLHEILYHLHPQGSIDEGRAVRFRSSSGGNLGVFKGPNIMQKKYNIRRSSNHGAGSKTNIKYK